MIPCKVYKNYPLIMLFLVRVFQSCLNLACAPVQWCVALEVIATVVEDFWLVALLNVEGKFFFSLSL